MRSDRMGSVSPQAFVIAGVSATLAWEVWARVIVPEMADAPLTPAVFIMFLFDLPDSYRWLGELVHYLTGLIVLPGLYVLFIHDWLPGPAVFRGAVCGGLLFVVSLGLVVPMGGLQPFLDFADVTRLYLVGHVLYALTLVVLYDAAARR